jgi:hypothetical protein
MTLLPSEFIEPSLAIIDDRALKNMKDVWPPVAWHSYQMICYAVFQTSFRTHFCLPCTNRFPSQSQPLSSVYVTLGNIFHSCGSSPDRGHIHSSKDLKVLGRFCLFVGLWTHQCESSRRAHFALWKWKRWYSDRIEGCDGAWENRDWLSEILGFVDTFSLSNVPSICISTVKGEQFISIFWRVLSIREYDNLDSGMPYACAPR